MCHPKRNLMFIAIVLAIAFVPAAIDPVAQTAESKTAVGENSRPQYEVLAKGIVASPTFSAQFKSAPLRLEFRNWVMGRGETETIPTPTRILMELRQGTITTTLSGEKNERQQGDFWMVEKGAALSIQNPGEVGVVRAIYIYENSR